MRDIVAHNPLWTVSFAWDETGQQFIGSNLLTGGDTKYRTESRQHPHTHTGLTKDHRLHISIPS